MTLANQYRNQKEKGVFNFTSFLFPGFIWRLFFFPKNGSKLFEIQFVKNVIENYLDWWEQVNLGLYSGDPTSIIDRGIFHSL